MNASASNGTSPQVVDTPVVTEKAIIANNASAATEEVYTPAETENEHEELIQSMGKMIRDLFCSDNSKVNATLDALIPNLDEDKTRCKSLVTAGGCLALTQLLEKCLDKAIDRFPACDQVKRLNELTELSTRRRTLNIVIILTFEHAESIGGIAAIGGVEAVVKIMKTFPKCQVLQQGACTSLLN
jgi:hypothetical protein